MDGTLLTSRPAIERVWNALSARWRLDPSGVSNYLHGRQATDAMDHFLPLLDPPQRTCEIEWVESHELQDTEGGVEIPGARDFLNALPPDRWAIVTSAARRRATFRIKAAGPPMPAIRLAAEDVRHGKPDPSGQLRAATLLGTTARQCLVFEDARRGSTPDFLPELMSWSSATIGAAGRLLRRRAREVLPNCQPNTAPAACA
jgi:sugar-phosphatase